MNMSKIIKLEVENVKRVNAVMIEPNGAVTVIGGRNGQGKTSVLDSIEYALGGKPDAERPIRDGNDKARIVVETEDLIVTRVFTASGSRLEVTGRDGRSYKRPQDMLDKMVGKLAFDPLGFSRMDGKAQAETLRGLLGVDFSELDSERKAVFDQRTDCNRELKNLAAQVAALPNHPDAPDFEVSVSDLTEEYERRIKINRMNAEERKKLEGYIESEAKYAEAIARTEAEICELKELLASQSELHAELVKKVNVFGDYIKRLSDENTDEIREQIRNAESINVKVRENHLRADLEHTHKVRASDVAALSGRIDEIDRIKADTLAKSKFPVDGLAFDENGVTFCGIPFKQCSSAEQLRVSVAMGLAMNPELRLILIRDGSLLDYESLQMIADMAGQANAQIIIERVGEGAECSVIIEDGMVKETKCD